jgi:hypothetical protein
MYWDVKLVEAKQDYTLFLMFEDGKAGLFDLSPYLNFGVFKELKNKAYFDQVAIEYGAVTWPHGQDIAPETLYEETIVSLS